MMDGNAFRTCLDPSVCYTESALLPYMRRGEVWTVQIRPEFANDMNGNENEQKPRTFEFM